MRDLLGGKGANLAEMTRVLGAERVPAGFTITTEACVAYMQAEGEMPAGLDAQVDEALGRLEQRTGKALGDPDDPLLVSVRSGARVSMPGMLDTILNLGLNASSVKGLAERTGNERFALGLAAPPGADVRERGPRHPGRALRGGDRRRQARGGRRARHRARARGAARADRALSRDLPRGDRRGVPGGSARAARRSRSGRCSTRGREAARSSTGASTGSPRAGGPPSTCSRWSSATGARTRARGSPSAATRSPASPSPRATSSPTPRARTWSRASATPRDSTRWRG